MQNEKSCNNKRIFIKKKIYSNKKNTFYLKEIV